MYVSVCLVYVDRKIKLKIIFDFYLNIFAVFYSGAEVITAYLLSKVELNNKLSTPFFMKITVKEILGGAVLCSAKLTGFLIRSSSIYCFFPPAQYSYVKTVMSFIPNLPLFKSYYLIPFTSIVKINHLNYSNLNSWLML